MIRQLLLNWFGKKKIKESRKDLEVAKLKDPSVLLGCVKGKEDVRDYPCSVKATDMPLPKKYTIPILPPVRSQGDKGSCASHAVIGAYETMILNMKPHRFMEGSELYHYYNARKNINNTFPNDSGMTIRDACKTIDKYHMATENLWPYITSKFNIKPPIIAYLMSGAYKIKEYQRLNSLDEIKASLTQNIPVVFGVQAKQSIFKLNRTNYLYVPTGENKGGHATLIFGHDDDKGVFKIRNSWSQSWGLEGNFEMKYSDFKTYSFDWFRILLK